MRRRARLALVAALLLLGGSALLMRVGEERTAPVTTPPARMPTMTEESYKRANSRRTLAPVLTADRDPAKDPPRRRDPFLVALPRGDGEPLVVLEANALRHSRVGELFVECAIRETPDGKNPFEEVRHEVGIDPLKDIDRVAFSSRVIFVSGFFDRLRLEKLESGSDVVHQGLHGRLYVPRPTPEARPGAGQDHVALWRDQLLLWGPRADLEAALERLERHGEEDPLPIPEGMTYGEAYGVVPGVTLGRLFTGTQADLGRRLGTLADSVELNLDAARDVAVIARVQGREAEQLDDLGRSFGSVLSLARFAARSRGDEELAALLEHARIVPGRSGFSMELLLPIELVERWLGSCGAVQASGSAGRQSLPATRR